MATASFIAQLVDAMVAVANGIPRAGQLADLTVFDGPGPLGESACALYIACENPFDADADDSGSATRSYAQLGARVMDERGSIPCVAHVTSGNSEYSADRLRAAAVVDAFATALRAAPPHPWMGVTGALFGDVTVARLSQLKTRDGNDVAFLFEITYRARGS